MLPGTVWVFLAESDKGQQGNLKADSFATISGRGFRSCVQFRDLLFEKLSFGLQSKRREICRHHNASPKFWRGGICNWRDILTLQYWKEMIGVGPCGKHKFFSALFKGREPSDLMVVVIMYDVSTAARLEWLGTFSNGICTTYQSLWKCIWICR